MLTLGGPQLRAVQGCFPMVSEATAPAQSARAPPGCSTRPSVWTRQVTVGAEVEAARVTALSSVTLVLPSLARAAADVVSFVVYVALSVLCSLPGTEGILE